MESRSQSEFIRNSNLFSGTFSYDHGMCVLDMETKNTTSVPSNLQQSLTRLVLGILINLHFNTKARFEESSSRFHGIRLKIEINIPTFGAKGTCSVALVTAKSPSRAARKLLPLASRQSVINRRVGPIRKVRIH